MNLSRLERVLRWFSPTIVTGPILEKELRVSSRRRRNYVLRFAYPVLLLAFVVLVWLEATEGLKGATQTYLVAHMGEAGIKIALTVAWFQFIAAQLVAIVLASSSVSGVSMMLPMRHWRYTKWSQAYRSPLNSSTWALAQRSA